MIILLLVLGLIFGSFINALVWRLHEQLDEDGNPKRLSKNHAADLSITKGRSMCPHCTHELAAKDLIPIVSWLLLRGKCRYCHKPISAQYPFVEALTAVLFAISYVAWPYSLTNNWAILLFATWLITLVGLIALAIYDIKWMLLPDKIVYPLLTLVFVSFIFQLALGRPISSAAQALLGVAIGGGIFWVLFQLSGGKWIGGGDVKLGFLLGLIVGSGTKAFLLLFFASLLGIIWIVPALVTKKMNQSSKVPFGPFLIVAGYIVMLWGQQLIDWYVQTFLTFQ